MIDLDGKKVDSEEFNKILSEVKNNEGIKQSSADKYDSLHDSVQSFNGIGMLEAVAGNVVLRGRNGERDHIFTLERCIDKYNHTMYLVQRYAMYGVRGWDTLKDIADDFKAKIIEACNQRKALGSSVPKNVEDFVLLHSK